MRIVLCIMSDVCVHTLCVFAASQSIENKASVFYTSALRIFFLSIILRLAYATHFFHLDRRNHIKYNFFSEVCFIEFKLYYIKIINIF